MPDKYLNSYPDPTKELSARAVQQWKARHVPIAVTIESADAAAQRYFAVRLPSNALLSRASSRRHAAVTGLTDLDFGDANDVDGLINGLDASAAAVSGAPLFPAAFANGTIADPLWKLLNYASDPMRELDLFFTANTDPGATVTIEVDLIFSIPD